MVISPANPLEDKFLQEKASPKVKHFSVISLCYTVLLPPSHLGLNLHLAGAGTHSEVILGALEIA